MQTISDVVFFDGPKGTGFSVPVFDPNEMMVNPIARLNDDSVNIIDNGKLVASIKLHKPDWQEKLKHLFNRYENPSVIVTQVSDKGVFFDAWEIDLINDQAAA